MLVLPDTEFSTPVATLALRKVVYEGAGGTDAPLGATWMCAEVGTRSPRLPCGSHPLQSGTRGSRLLSGGGLSALFFFCNKTKLLYKLKLCQSKIQ